MNLFIFLQSQKNLAEEAIDNKKTLSIYNLIMEGGTGGKIIMALLFILLVVAVFIYFERLFAIKAASKVDKNFMSQIKDNVSRGRIDEARMLCAQQTKSAAAKLIQKGISRIGKPLEDIHTAIENAGRLEIYKLEKNVSVLATISGAAPMIGFLGTVIGMILSIFEIANSGGSIDIKTMADGLYTAMTTTVGGLVVGIIAYIAYNHLVVKTNKVVYQMEAQSVEFLDLLNEPI